MHVERAYRGLGWFLFALAAARIFSRSGMVALIDLHVTGGSSGAVPGPFLVHSFLLRRSESRGCCTGNAAGAAGGAAAP